MSKPFGCTDVRTVACCWESPNAFTKEFLWKTVIGSLGFLGRNLVFIGSGTLREKKITKYPNTANRLESSKLQVFKIPPSKAGEMAQRLRALIALPEVLSSNPSNHMVAHNHL